MSELFTDGRDDTAALVVEDTRMNPVLTADESKPIPSAFISSPSANVKTLVSAYSALHSKSTPIVPTIIKSTRNSFIASHSVAAPSAPSASNVTFAVAVAVSEVVPSKISVPISSPVKTATIKPLSFSLKKSTAETDDDKKKRIKDEDEEKDEDEDKDKVERKEKTISSPAQHVRSIVSRFEGPQEKYTAADITEMEVNDSRVRVLILENEQKIRDTRAALDILNKKPSPSKPFKIQAANLGASSSSSSNSHSESKKIVTPITIPMQSLSSSVNSRHSDLDKNMDMDKNTDMDSETVGTQDYEDDSASFEESWGESTGDSTLESDESSDTCAVFSKALASESSVALKTVAPSAVLPHATPVRFSSTTAGHIVAPSNKMPSSLNIRLVSRSPLDKSTIKFTVPSHIVPKLVFPPSVSRVSHHAPKRLSAGKA